MGGTHCARSEAECSVRCWSHQASPRSLRPRSALVGTICANCAFVSGCASGSALAAPVILRSSATLGIWIGIFFEGLDIRTDLSSVGAPKADHPVLVATVGHHAGSHWVPVTDDCAGDW